MTTHGSEHNHDHDEHLDHVRRRKFSIRGQWMNLVVLTITWVLLSGNASLLTVASGLLLAVLISWVFPLPSIQWGGRLRPLGLAYLVVRLLYDLATASVRLSRYAFSRGPLPDTAIIAVRLNSDADLYQVGTGSILSVVPGSVVVDARRKTRTLYLHIFPTSPDRLDAEREASLAAERRILGAFASNAEIEAARLKAGGRV
ncbi:Na+/H+ antiporter subunit E [Propionibacteriaceae bacterium G1746]|uniref:Na+/H+ antiporter subunit E n=1 Tax=Aestuariimicrobium sp. G57 TaxID=3418485 RepID=UPI003C2832A0